MRVDKENVTVDKGDVVKFSPWVFGRRQEASDEGTGPLKHPKPPLPPTDMQFRQPTDVAWDSAGNTYISDGYVNSRVAKIDKNGVWVKSWGEPGDKPGQFATLHSIAIDNQNHVYIATANPNRSIAMADLNLCSAINFVIGNTPQEGSTWPRVRLWVVCIPPGQNQVLYIGYLYPTKK